MLSTSVSNIDLFRTWRGDEELDLNWLLQKILGPREQTPQMRAGEAFHKALENLSVNEAETISADKYSFHFACDCELPAVRAKELRVQKPYGELTVRGRVDAIIGRLVIDYKTTAQFDPDRLMSGYQWRYYLDMMQADRFRWNVFVLAEGDDPLTYYVRDVHTLEQTRYPKLHEDCARLAGKFAQFAKQHLVTPAEKSLYITEKDVVQVG